MKMIMYKEDWKRLKDAMEKDIHAAERSIEINRAFLKVAEEKLKNSKPDPDVVDIGEGLAKVKLDKKPAGVG